MADRPHSPEFSENFYKNLDNVKNFLAPEGIREFDRLLDYLFEPVIPTLCRYSQSGRLFRNHPVRSLEAQILLDKLGSLSKSGDELREWVAGEYLVLYLIRNNRVIFLSIRHHRQLSFDFLRFWQ